jgi:hypothetical protein
LLIEDPTLLSSIPIRWTYSAEQLLRFCFSLR